MRKNKLLIVVGIICLIAAGVWVAGRLKSGESRQEEATEIFPKEGIIENFITTTGSVLPKNRLEVKPPVNGRVESVLVKEGQVVKTGETLAWMSSTERAALLDAARGQGEKVLQYWKEVYKAIPLISPIDGEVIVATTQPGQTVTTSDAVVVLSDHLIVRAQVDETDIGKISKEGAAVISLDAYPDIKIKARVEHIYYESETVNNVTVYKVDLVPEEVPAFFRSGMNASVNFVAIRKENILTVPLEAVHIEKGKSEAFVYVRRGEEDSVKQAVTLGISDDKNYEIISGLTANDVVLITPEKYSLPGVANAGKNPFMPSFKRKSKTISPP